MSIKSPSAVVSTVRGGVVGSRRERRRGSVRRVVWAAAVVSGAMGGLAGSPVFAVDYNLGSFTAGTFNWDAAIWSPAGTPGVGDKIVISGDPAGAITVNYSGSGIVTRSIESISVTDTVAAAMSNFAFRPGVSGSGLQFTTTSPSVSTNLINVASGAQRLMVSTPLFQSGSTFTKGGNGSVNLHFEIGSSATSWNNNVTSLVSTGGGASGSRALWLSTTGPAISMPDTNFSTDNQRLVVSGPGTFTANNKTLNIGTGTNNHLSIGGQATFSLTGSTVLTANLVTMGSNNSNEFYLGSDATFAVGAGATANIVSLRMGDQKGTPGSVRFTQTGGTTNISSDAYLGNFPNNINGNQTHTYTANVSGGNVNFTRPSGNIDFHVARNGRTGGTGTVAFNGSLSVSGTGSVNLGNFTRLLLGSDTSVNVNDPTNAVLHLDGGNVTTAREIARATGAGVTALDSARVLFNGGTVTATASITELLNGFNGTLSVNDGVFVQANGAVISVNSGANVGTAANLRHDPLSVGGGLTKLGAGTLSVTATGSTFTGPVTVGAGTLVVSNAAALGAGTANINLAASTVLRPSASFTTARPVSATGNDAQVLVPNAVTTTFTGGFTEGYVPAGTHQFRFESTGTVAVTTTPINQPGLQVNLGQGGLLILGVAGNDYRRFLNFFGTVRTDVAAALDPAAEFEMRLNGTTLDLNGNNQGVGGLTATTGALTAVVTSPTAAQLALSLPTAVARTFGGTFTGGNIDLVMSSVGTGVQNLSNNLNVVDDVTVNSGRLNMNCSGDTLTVNGGTFSPGVGLGGINLATDVTVGASGTLELEINKAGVVLTNDKVILGGNANLAGNLNIVLLAAVPDLALGDSFDLIDGTIASNTAAITLPALSDPLLTWDASGLAPGGNGVISVVLIPEPAALALLTPATIPLLRRRRR